MLYPKIGIRPTIDGRWGGIRESLEAQTMGLAQAAQTLSHPCATPTVRLCRPSSAPVPSAAARRQPDARNTLPRRT